ncbi:MAG: hypothetical protein ACXAAM_04610 [Candidatus Heimdallarchaeaceae archaeon]|jgi:hypothetical protein
MEGRHRSKEGIIYPFDEEPSKIDKKLYLHINFDKILGKGYKIIVLNQQPGIGKTYTVMNYILSKCKKDNNFTFFYFTDRHKTIDEHLNILRKEDKKIVETFAHWKGFGKHCKDHHDSENIDRLLGFNVPIEAVIKQYKLDDIYNNYLDQFNNTKRVFAPFQYLSKDEFIKNPPQIVFLDERISQLETYTFNGNEIAKVLELIKAPSEYIDHAKSGKKEDIQFFWDENVREKIEKLYNKAIISAVAKGRKRLDKYKKFNPYKLLPYLSWSKIYNYDIDSYSLPFYYKALDVVTEKNVPIVILDATFNKGLFSYFLESYNGEMREKRPKTYKSFKDLRIKILTSDVSNSETTIYRMRPGGSWPKRSFTEYRDSTWEWLLTDLKELRSIFGDANIGIITYKELSWLFEAMNFDIEYFGNLRGTNKLENKLVLVIIGTWVPLPPSWIEVKKKEKDETETDKKDKIKISKKKKEYIDNIAKKYFLKKITQNDVIEARVGAPLPIELDYPELYGEDDSKSRLPIFIDSQLKSIEGIEKLFCYSDADRTDSFPISMINTIWFDEIYQAIHRNRGLRHTRIIFSYAWFPERKMMVKYNGNWIPYLSFNYNLRDEFPSTKKILDGKSIKKVFDEEDKEKVFSYYGQRYKAGIMQKLMKYIELDENVTDISKEFKIHTKGKKRGAYTTPINELKKAYKKVKEIVEYKEK